MYSSRGELCWVGHHGGSCSSAKLRQHVSCSRPNGELTTAKQLGERCASGKQERRWEHVCRCSGSGVILMAALCFQHSLATANFAAHLRAVPRTLCHPQSLVLAAASLTWTLGRWRRSPAVLKSATLQSSSHGCTHRQPPVQSHPHIIISTTLTCVQCPGRRPTLYHPQSPLPAAVHLARRPGRWGIHSVRSSAARMCPCPHPTAVRCDRCCPWRCTGCWGAMPQCPHQTGGLHVTMTRRSSRLSAQCSCSRQGCVIRYSCNTRKSQTHKAK
jgi:hypothetical protein